MSHLNVPQRGKGCLLAVAAIIVPPLVLAALVVVAVMQDWALFAGALGVR